MLQYADSKRLLKPDSKILAAVSGGVDSMVMMRLLHDAGVKMCVAHCNFGLRGKESDLDEEFVKAETEKSGIKCFVEHFDTIGYASQNGISIQMAAREQRYRWFNELAERDSFDAIAIAHNSDDSIETLFINLARGTSIHGLTGIRPKNGKIIRPLLFASSNEIRDYAKTNEIAFREDSSNESDKYARNHIRHNVIPAIEKFFPAIKQSIERSLEHFTAVEMFYNEAIEQYKCKIITTIDDLVYIDLPGLMQSPSPQALLYEILKPYSFPTTTAEEILKDRKHTSGRQFFSDTHRLVLDRQKLILSLRHSALDAENPSYVDINILKMEKFKKYTGFTPDTDHNTACLDDDKLRYPLLLRKWEHGDTFRPLGMKCKKKLSDFFIDEKLSLIEKEKCLVLVSDGQIAWIVGLRIDDRFKIRKETKNIVRIKKSINHKP